ncbi:MAG: RT0821/Lpp0805 family surface protein [Rhodospirillales bacterium]|nr:RT0821/Lpp0805 family surface protein [Rhodospirillales bacterium]
MARKHTPTQHGPSQHGPLAAKALVAALIALFASLWTLEPAFADPPSWAPAHGYRAKHKQKYEYKAQKQYYEPVYAAPYDLDVGHCNRTLLGGVLGGATGAAIGSQIGSGDERTAAIIGGTIIGILVGGSIGQHMDMIDQNCVGQTLEHAGDGETIRWNDPNQGGQYQVTPVKTYQINDGRYCREYTATSVIGGQAQETYGTACRQPDGSWQLVS